MFTPLRIGMHKKVSNPKRSVHNIWCFYGFHVNLWSNFVLAGGGGSFDPGSWGNQTWSPDLSHCLLGKLASFCALWLPNGTGLFPAQKRVENFWWSSGNYHKTKNSKPKKTSWDGWVPASFGVGLKGKQKEPYDVWCPPILRHVKQKTDLHTKCLGTGPLTQRLFEDMTR